MTDRLKLKTLEIAGYKSVDSEGQSVSFGDITVFIGANGAGKSNLVHFFNMLNYMSTGALQEFIGRQGFAESLLYLGSKHTPIIDATLEFRSNSATDTYSFKLAHAAGDALIFTHENAQHQAPGYNQPAELDFGAGHRESRLYEDFKSDGRTSKTSQVIYTLLRQCQVFQFHDTSDTARIRGQGYIDDHMYLKSDGGNLAAFLYAMKERKRTERYYNRIVRHIQMILPQFKDFMLQPSGANNNYIRLNFQEVGADYLFGPHQLSDGSLRFMALTALLLQPPETLPQAIILDEPELGLHPAAITALAGMIRTASQNCQVILATQSPRLVDEFDAHEIVIAERDQENKRSIFRRPDAEALSEWLERYSISELWEKNVLGGRP